jgi:hypothetical protein
MENKMKFKAGLWIDHRRCVVVLIKNNKIEKKIINSNTERHLRRIGGKSSITSFESQKVKADGRQERHFTAHLNTYFDEIISYIHDAESILIFGPGEAKGELLKRINKNKISGQIKEVETTDKMTDSQIAAKVKEHLLKLEKK